MTHQDPPVRLILDRSALTAYLAGSVHVAEPLHEIVDDGVRFGIPLPVAVEALASATAVEADILNRLFDHPSCALLSDEPTSLPELVYWRRATGAPDRAAAAVAALTHQTSILTREAKAYGDWVPVIPIDD